VDDAFFIHLLRHHAIRLVDIKNDVHPTQNPLLRSPVDSAKSDLAVKLVRDYA